MNHRLFCTLCLALVCGPAIGQKPTAQSLDRLNKLMDFYCGQMHPILAGSRILAYAESHQIPVATVDEMTRERITRVAADFEQGDGRRKNYSGLFYLRMMTFLSRPSSAATNAQFILTFTRSTNETIRSHAARSYVRHEGRKAVPFLRKMLDDPRFSSSDYYVAYREFGRQVARDKGLGTNVDEAVAFLLERTEKEKKGDAAKILDRVLCDILPEYKTSEQRHNLAVRMMNDVQTHMVYRNHFGQVRGQVEAVPEGKRADFAPFMEKMRAKGSGASTNAAGGKKE